MGVQGVNMRLLTRCKILHVPSLLADIFFPNSPSSSYKREMVHLKGAVSRQPTSFCLILPITRPQSLWNLK